MVTQDAHSTHAEDGAITPPLLDVQHVSFGYDAKPLLYDISMQVRKGEIIGLLGPNGSGKTTLLRLISGLFIPQKGQIVLEGRDLRQWGRRNAARRIAVVPQELHMPFAFTVEQMVGLGRTPFVRPFLGERTAHDRSIIDNALQTASMMPFAHRIFNELSGGERQRVLIAMALAQEPSLLLLDEPTSHLDIKYQIETLELVQRLNAEQGVTVIAAIHDLNLAARYFPRLVLFQQGIVADGVPAEVLNPSLLSRVYGIDVHVGILRGGTHLSVLPPMDEERQVPKRHPIVHIIAGGGSGEILMRTLADEHIPFSAGALNKGDSDCVLALRLAENVIVEQPYAPISEVALQQTSSCIEDVSVLVICNVPFGHGNVALLRQALEAASHGLPVLLLATSDASVCGVDGIMKIDSTSTQGTEIIGGDYTSGETSRFIRELLQLGAVIAYSISDVIQYIRRTIPVT